MKLQNTESVSDFWNNLPEYIKNDTVIEQIDLVFPEYLIDNVEFYTYTFDKVSELYSNYFVVAEDSVIDFNISYSDCCRQIVNGLKDTYKQKRNLVVDDIEDIIHDMYYEKYIEYTKNKKIAIVLDILKENTEKEKKS